MTGLFLLALPAAFAQGLDIEGKISKKDSDDDGIIDHWDLCDGSDDTVDLDADGVADCAQSFFTTGMFDGLSDAQTWGGTHSYRASVDARGYSASGSVLLDSAGVVTKTVWSPCVAVSGGTDHILLAEARAQENFGRVDADIWLHEFSDPSCDSSVQVGYRILETLSGNTGGWITVGDRVTTHAQARYVRLTVISWAQAGTGATPSVWLDNVLLHDDLGNLGEDDSSSSTD